MATIKSLRPDLLQDHQLTKSVKPIEEVMPTDYFNKEVVQIPDIGEPPTACFFIMSDIDPSRW